MMDRQTLVPIVVKAVRHYRGRADHAAVAKYIWENYERDLKRAGRFFYKWQYEARWAADELKRQGILEPTKISGRGILQLKRR
jgi:hypothetical protein